MRPAGWFPRELARRLRPSLRRVGAAWFLWLAWVAAVPVDAAPSPEAAEDKAIVFDPPTRTYRAKPGEESAVLTFRVTNVSAEEVVIHDVYTSCGCTVPTLPSQPWVLAPGAGGNLDLTISLRGKVGTLVKTATLETRRGSRVLTFQVVMPSPPLDREARERNRQLASADRQAVFQGDCARCHVPPALGRTGEALYQSACGVCHEAGHRASMVPDLATLDHPVDWKTMIAAGRPGTLMPAFAEELGGPLSRAEIESLAAYLGARFASAPRSK